MKTCEMISPYLDRTLRGEDLERFEKHMETCDGCSAAARAWADIESRLMTVAEQEEISSSPTTGEALQLVQRARREIGERSTVGRRRPAWVPIAASLILAGALGVLVGHRMADQGLSAGDEVVVNEISGAFDTYQTDRNSSTSVRLGSDTIHLGPSSRVVVAGTGDEARIILREGTIACDVARRFEGGGFTVEADAFTVRVIGTRFLVDLGDGAGPVVTVSRGAVQVHGEVIGDLEVARNESLVIASGAGVRAADPETLERLEAIFVGQVLSRVDNDLEDKPPGENMVEPVREDSGLSEKSSRVQSKNREPDTPEVGGADEGGLSRWREWVIGGRLEEASAALREHLVAAPSDVDAWSLLADSERKRSNWEGAVEAYGHQIALIDGERANQARFKAAVIVQDRLADQRRAAGLLERILVEGDDGSLIAARARVRLASALLALGKPEQAREHLQQVIRSCGDGATREKARDMLDRIDRKKAY